MKIDENEELAVGFWGFTAHVEVRPQYRFVPQDPPVEKGDLWYRIVLGVTFNDDTGECGVFGDLTTPWLESVEEAAVQAKTLAGMTVAWTELDEVADDYIQKKGEVSFERLIDQAVARFELVSGTGKPPSEV